MLTAFILVLAAAGPAAAQTAGVCNTGAVPVVEPKLQRAVKHVCLLRTGAMNYHYGVLEPDCATLGTNGSSRD